VRKQDTGQLAKKGRTEPFQISPKSFRMNSYKNTIRKPFKMNTYQISARGAACQPFATISGLNLILSVSNAGSLPRLIRRRKGTIRRQFTFHTVAGRISRSRGHSKGRSRGARANDGSRRKCVVGYGNSGAFENLSRMRG
jgi:hypothetical protein